MKKLFALISLLGLVAGMGGALNASEEAGDTQSTLDTIFLYHYFQNPGKAQTLKFKFAATPGEKFIIFWKGSIFSDATDTISIETEKEIEVAYTFTSGYTISRPQSNVALFALTPNGHITSLRIDSTYKYTDLTFKNCMLLDTIQVVHNTLENLSIMNCPTLKFLDISHNKLRGWYIGETSSITYLDCSHNNINYFYPTFSSLRTLDISYNRELRQFLRDYCPSLTDLTICCNDSLETLDLSNLPLQHLTCTENQKLSRINADNCRFQTLDVSGNPALEMLECSDNQLTSLTAQNCPALTSINCRRNQLSYLDLNYCKSLRRLYCDNNRLFSLDICGLDKLESLGVSHNRLSSIEIPEDIKSLSLSCANNHIPIATLVEWAKRNLRIKYVSPQFLTAGFIQVGNVLDMREDCQRDYGNPYTTQCAVLQNEEEADEHSCTMGKEYEPDYGLMTFHKAGTYRIRLSTYGITYAADTFYYDLTVVDSVVRPQFSIPSGAVWPDTALVLNSPTPDARIYYTTDGSEPDETALAYAAPIRITEAVTIKAIAIQDTFKSHIAIATYTIDTVAKPTFSIPSEAVVWPDTFLVLRSTTPDTRIYYTTDGSAPDETDLEYTTPIRITKTITIKAIAVYKTLTSQVATATYSINTVARPTFSIPSGAVVWPDTFLVLRTTTPNARIYYTTDGSTPDETDLAYTTPIRITEALTIKAIAVYKTVQSQATDATYTIGSVAQPTFSIPSGTIWPDTSLVLRTTTPNARIYYTTDETEPDETALEYTTPIRISNARTIKAVAVYKTLKSQVATATYSINTVARPVFSIPSGNVKIGTIVSLSSTTPDARIYYTADGSTPDETDLLYQKPIYITKNMTIKAFAIYKTIKSQVATATYTIDSVANEHDLRASKLRVYTRDQTIYLSETVGEVAVFTMGGTCFYRGFDTAIPVKQSGIYIVSAAGRRWKVAVR